MFKTVPVHNFGYFTYVGKKIKKFKIGKKIKKKCKIFAFILIRSGTETNCRIRIRIETNANP